MLSFADARRALDAECFKLEIYNLQTKFCFVLGRLEKRIDDTDANGAAEPKPSLSGEPLSELHAIPHIYPHTCGSRFRWQPLLYTICPI